MENTRFSNKKYQTITSVKYLEKSKLVFVGFDNGEEVSVKLAEITPKGFQMREGGEIKIDEEGLDFKLPGKNLEDWEISWDKIRELTDKEFAKLLIEATGKSIVKILGESLKTIRIEKGLSQAYVAEMAGMVPSNLSRIENGHYNISISTLMRITRAMRLTLKDVLNSGLLQYY